MTDNFFGFIFDSGDEDYNVRYFFELVISALVMNKSSNPIRFYYGDISDSSRYVDIDRFISRNKMCTIVGKPTFKDWPYFICLYGISCIQRNAIEKILKVLNVTREARILKQKQKLQPKKYGES